MKSDEDAKLLALCVDGMKSGRLDEADEAALRRWWVPQKERAEGLVEALVARPVADWTTQILAHLSATSPFRVRKITLGSTRRS